MFGRDFYPTPEELLHQILAGVSVSGLVILEPSAGSGNIVDYCLQFGAKEVIACEIESRLRKIIEGKCKVIAHDFMTVTSDQVSHIDMIIMNPPFSKAQEHIKHAFEIAPTGCTIIAQCNAETIKNRWSSYRKELISIIEQYGSYYFLEDAYTKAERTTGVEIAVVTLTKPGASTEDEFAGFFMDEEVEEQANGLIPYNVVRDIVNRHVETMKLFDQQLELAVRINTLSGSLLKSNIGFRCEVDKQEVTRNDFRKDLQKSSWKYIFNKMGMEKYMTKALKEDMNRFVEKQETVPFSMRNIYRMIEIVAGTHSGRMEKALIEVFDNLTMHYADNRYHLPGWKTNSHYLIGQKFIIPYLVNCAYSGGMGLVYQSGHSWSERMDDFQKAICHLTATNYSEIGSLWDFFHKNRKDQVYWFNTWYTWGHFTFKGFKKGTAHFKFNDLKVWERFNREIARIKGYPLPEHI